MDMSIVNPLTSGDQMVDLKPSKQKVEYSKAVIDAMVLSGQLTPEGAAFLEIAPDPWHDKGISGFKGVCDNYSGQSVVYSIPQEQAISKPPSFSSGPWNVRITTNPIATSIGMSPYTFVSNVGRQTSSASFAMWPVQVDYSNGTDDFTEFVNVNTTGLSLPSNFLKGPYKVAALGLEVINTTADIYRQGLVSAARMNQNGYYNFTSTLYADDNNWNPLSLFPVRSCPKNLAELVQLPNPWQEKAAEGCYSVVELLAIGSTPPTAIPQFPVWTDDDFDAGIATSHPNWWAPTLTNIAVTEGFLRYAPPKNSGHVPQNSTVIMFTGLSEQTTLTLRARWILERYPNDSEPDIINLATPTAPYDPMALEIYSKLMRKTPAAVKFSMNPAGEWWKSMLAGIADIASSGLMMMPHPLAKGAGALIGAARQAVAPDIPVQLAARAVSKPAIPAKRPVPKSTPGIKFISNAEIQAQKKKNRKKKKKKTA